jgi:hypothetical protein
MNLFNPLRGGLNVLIIMSGLISEIVILAVLTVIWFWNDLVKNNKYDSEVVILTIVIILGYLIYLYV